MKLFNGDGLWKKVSAVVGTIAAILVLSWQIGDRISKARAEDIAASEVKIMAEVNKADVQLAGLVYEQQRRTDLRHWTQERDRATIELRRIKKALSRNPNDLDLLEEQEYWKDIKKQAKEELNKLLNP